MFTCIFHFLKNKIHLCICALNIKFLIDVLLKLMIDNSINNRLINNYLKEEYITILNFDLSTEYLSLLHTIILLKTSHRQDLKKIDQIIKFVLNHRIMGFSPFTPLYF